ncbi:hypothetical protein FRC08_004901 [Ceratobasidium sp. 394]|nr:hypothetical protein FRC08_004901 [Ceratobasidium sp. 394]
MSSWSVAQVVLAQSLVAAALGLITRYFLGTEDDSPTEPDLAVQANPPYRAGAFDLEFDNEDGDFDEPEGFDEADKMELDGFKSFDELDLSDGSAEDPEEFPTFDDDTDVPNLPPVPPPVYNDEDDDLQADPDGDGGDGSEVDLLMAAVLLAIVYFITKMRGPYGLTPTGGKAPCKQLATK